MAKSSVRHIGDDQLVYGMPKHMVGQAGSSPKDPKGDFYWTVHPKPKACEKCKALEGREFMVEPSRPHPNCKCEIKKHPLRRKKRYINGSVTGYSRESFVGGRQVEITFIGISGGITSGVQLLSNQGHSQQIACMPLTTNSAMLADCQTRTSR